ncbi:1-phosphofructokinase [Salibacterium salarium]|uniref:Tagatose-6-phosphate kinase n=1 Tax=Salibacterium salarium TaxID=284579 RepID=A0A428N3M1_9BACI|nr:1-phosphofructokinase [Salibacterium salarium]RSL32902.1 1-phosphofructokinase [Salibacterium salarium]
MIYTVTLNPALDYVIEAPDFQTGTINRSKEDLKYPGGKGINVSRVLDRLGVTSKALGFAGGFTGDYIKQVLNEENITTDFVDVNGDTRINVKIRGEEETEINGTSPAISQENINHLLTKLEKLEENDQLVLAGSLPSMLPDDLYQTLMSGLKEKKVNVYLDTSGKPLKAALEAKPYFVKPNHNELGDLYHTTITSVEEAIRYGEKMMQDYEINHAVISMAGEGAIYLNEKGAYQAIPPKRPAVNSVGAGDSLVAGFVAKHLSSDNPEDVLTYAVATGSATAFSETFCTREEVEDVYSQVQTKTLREKE